MTIQDRIHEAEREVCDVAAEMLALLDVHETMRLKGVGERRASAGRLTTCRAKLKNKLHKLDTLREEYSQ